MCIGLPGRILEVLPGRVRHARVAFGEVVQEVSLALLPEAEVGGYVLVNLGTAIQLLDEAEALERLELLGAFAASLDARPEAPEVFQRPAPAVL